MDEGTVCYNLYITWKNTCDACGGQNVMETDVEQERKDKGNKRDNRDKREKRGRKKREMSTAQMIALGFAAAVLIGSLLLCLPVCSSDGTWTNYLDALFTATTSVCVTGLVVVDTYAHWNAFGQGVILLLIQCGGLGIVTLTTALMVLIGKKVTLKDRLLLSASFNLDTMQGLVRFLVRVLKGTLLVEGIGAICCLPIFVPEYGIRGIWVSVFHAVSAFCNAGMDIIGTDSLMAYVGNPWLNLVTMLLIVLGGIGFIVWWDVLRVIRKIRAGNVARRFWFRQLRLHTKIVLLMTLALVFGGALLVFLLEYGNPETLGNLPFGTKLLASLFQSVSFRTAGFATISQKGLSGGSVIVGILLMIIGGSPIGTAGGIKTTTVAIVLFTTMATIKGDADVKVFRRTIPTRTLRKAISVTLVFGMVLLSVIVLMSVLEPGSMTDIAYETASALGTVGLSRSYTATMNAAGKVVILLCMFLGRIGPISMAIALHLRGHNKTEVKYPEEDVTVG